MKQYLLFIGVAAFALSGCSSPGNPGSVGGAAPAATEVSAPTPAAALSPIFSQLALWVPAATWGNAQVSVEDTPYGSVSGMTVEGEIKGSDKSISRNLEDQDYLARLGFSEDINLAADGPGASNWGYVKKENGKTEVVIFRYSTNRLLGPESEAAPFANLSVFVSEPFVSR